MRGGLFGFGGFGRGGQGGVFRFVGGGGGGGALLGRRCGGRGGSTHNWTTAPCQHSPPTPTHPG